MTDTVKSALQESLPSFSCPLTFDVMRDPVMLAETGQTYEREEIERWLSNNDTCPSTNVRLHGKHQLVSNIGLRKAIEEWSVLY